jgi:DNA-directed RNA polymerase subunit RPC12/RpoP
VLDESAEFRCSHCHQRVGVTSAERTDALRCRGCGSVRRFVDGGRGVVVDPRGVATVSWSYWVWESSLDVEPHAARLALAAVPATFFAALFVWATLREARHGVTWDSVWLSLLALLAARFCVPGLIRLLRQWLQPLPTLRVTADGITRITSLHRASFMAWSDIGGFTIHRLNGAPHTLTIDMKAGTRVRRAEWASARAGRWWLLESANAIPWAQLPMAMEDLVPRMCRFRP